MKLRLTLEADKDLTAIARYTLRHFGPGQKEVYAELVERAFAMLLENPHRPSSQSRHELGKDVRSFHLALAAGRRRGASHVVYYLCREQELIVLRVLGDEMEPRSRIRKALTSSE
jgi:toxin ParE1/3/4